MIGHFIIFLLVMVVCVYSILKLHQLNRGAHHILRIDHRILDYEGKLTDSILSQIRYKKKYILTRDAALYDQFLSSREDFHRFLSEALTIADTSEKKASLRNINVYNEHLRSLIDKEIGQMQRNEAYSKRWYEQETEKVVDGILGELKKLEASSRMDIQQSMKTLGDSTGFAQKLAITMSALAMILVIVTSFWITRSISKPLAVLMAKTKEISKGVFDSNVMVTSPPEIAHLAEAFNSMCSKLKMVDKMKSDFFSSMSHELRTPLTSIKEGVHLLQDGVAGTTTEKQNRLLAILSEESNRLISLVNSLLDLSKMEAGMMKYDFEPRRLPPLIQRAVTEMSPLIEGKGIILKTEIDEELPVVRLDQERILQVLRNLIGNAVKFTPKGGQVGISARCTNRSVEVSVSDTGPGISTENLQTIFEKFHQATFKNSENIKGTGLGLAIVKHIISAHGGTVWAESEPGHGSSFIFLLPA